jgi:sulfate adenylyltransferase
MSGLIVPHGKEEKLIPLLLERSELPAEFSRPDVVKILQDYYQGLEEKVEIKLHGAASGDVDKK